MCKHLCARISIDETFKVAGMCSVWEGNDRCKKRYVQTTYAVQTAHSSVTQLMCGIQMMPSKSAESKQCLIQAILSHQEGEGSTRTRYVATDCPDVDVSMLKRVGWQRFGPEHIIDVRDDSWHVQDRILRGTGAAVLKEHPDVRKGLKAV